MISLINDLIDLPPSDRKKYACFAAAFFVLIGSMIATRPARTAEFHVLCGFEAEAYVRVVLPVFMFAVLLIYNAAQSASSTPRAFVAGVCITYGLATVIITLLVSMKTWLPFCPDILVAGDVLGETCAAKGSDPLRSCIGWTLFLVFETRGVIMPPMFWSVVNDSSSIESSKRTYAALILSGNIGGIVGSSVALYNSHPTFLFNLQAVSLAIFLFLMWQALAPPPHRDGGLREMELASHGRIKESDGDVGGSRSTAVGSGTTLRREAAKMWREATQGVVLIATKPYVAGILLVSWAFLLPRSVLDFQGNRQASLTFGEGQEGKQAKIAFFAKLNLWGSISICAVAALGAPEALKRLGPGVVVCLLPVVLAVAVMGYWASTASTALYAINAVLLLVNVMERAVNTPAREMLYVCTSSEIKYKAKSWGDVYGNTALKMLGSGFSIVSGGLFGFLEAVALLIWCAFWLYGASVVRRTNARLEAAGEVIS